MPSICAARLRLPSVSLSTACVKQAGEATEKGAEAIEGAEKQVIHKAEDAIK